MRPARSHRLPAVLVAASCTLLLVSCSSSDASPASTTTVVTHPATVPSSTEVASTEPPATEPPATEASTTMAPTTTEPEVVATADQIAAALDIDPSQLGDGFVVAPPDAPDMAAALEQTRLDTAANTAACSSLQLLTATPDFSRVYATPASDVVTVHVYVVRPPSGAPARFDDISGSVDQLAECLLAVGSAGLDTFFGANNSTGITGGTQRLVGSVAPPATLAADGAVAFATKTDLEGATPFTIDGKFIVFRVGGMVVTIEAGSPVDAAGPADRGAGVVATQLSNLVV